MLQQGTTGRFQHLSTGVLPAPQSMNYLYFICKLVIMGESSKHSPWRHRWHYDNSY